MRIATAFAVQSDNRQLQARCFEIWSGGLVYRSGVGHRVAAALSANRTLPSSFLCAIVFAAWFGSAGADLLALRWRYWRSSTLRRLGLFVCRSGDRDTAHRHLYHCCSYRGLAERSAGAQRTLSGARAALQAALLRRISSKTLQLEHEVVGRPRRARPRFPRSAR